MSKKSITMPEYIVFAKDNFKKNDIKTIFEIGGLDGKDSLLFKKEFQNAEVYMFEALHENYMNCINKLKNIHVFNYVIFNRNGRIKFYKKNINGLHSVFDRGKKYGTKAIRLKCYRMDTVCKKLNIKCIDMLKIDVEGATLEVLKGLGKLLNTVKIMHIETEDYPFFKGQKLDNEVSKFLLTKRFKLIARTGFNPTQKGKQYDTVWIKDSNSK